MDQHVDASDSRESTIDRLAQAVARHVGSAGDHVTALPALPLHRRDAPTGPVDCIYPLSLAVTAQGSKQVTIGGKVLNYGPGQSMLLTIDLPIVAHVTRATTREPYLGLVLKLDASLVAQAASEMKLPRPDDAHAHELTPIERLDSELFDALRRLIALLDDPRLLPRLAPLIQQEIIIRLLAGPYGAHLRQLSVIKPPREQVARVVAWIKQNFTKAIPVDELASNANMSPSVFRQHFRAITGMNPLQYLKQLRLQEARQLLLKRNIDAGSAAVLVGYESASQFSREYRRLFGAPPQQDVRRMRSS
jgi:AraC-like DNA-binding protein